MPTSQPKNLGRLVAVHGIAPAYMQRAVFIAVLSFVFFLAMMVMFYIRENIGYFLLASAFLLIYVVMMISWVMQRKNVVEVFENGIRYKKDEVDWSEIEKVSDNGRIERKTGKPISLASSLHEFQGLVKLIEHKASE